MLWHRGIYFASAIAATGLLAQLAWFLDDRVGLHLVDRTIRALRH